MGVLYLVATPIGNLRDITLRALDTLKEVNLIACEDTRTTLKLLSHYDIHTPLASYYEHDQIFSGDRILAALAAGNVALVSESGMPAISDPGYQLVQRAIAAGHTIVPIPGACAAIAALAISGLPTDSFIFVGFLPRQQQARERRLQELAPWQHTLIFYESPRRVPDLLKELFEAYGNRAVAVIRELSKMHEETWRGNLKAATSHFAKDQRGEFTIIVAGQTPATWTESEVAQAMQQALLEGVSLSEAARKVAELSGWPKAVVYRLGLNCNQ